MLTALSRMVAEAAQPKAKQSPATKAAKTKREEMFKQAKEAEKPATTTTDATPQPATA